MSQLPPLKSFKDLAEGLLGKEVAVKEGDAVDATDKPGCMIAEYLEPDGSVGAVGMVDFPLAVYLGAAFSLLPPGGAQDMVEEHDAPKNVLENTAEFLNVFAHPLYESLGAHQRLGRVWYPGDTPAPEIAGVLGSTNRRNVYCDVKGYGGGNMSVIRTKE